MADDSKLRLVLRGHTIAEEAAVTDSGGESFVAVAKPPPVGALLEAYEGGQRRLIEVARVLESESGERGRGFFVRSVDDDEGRLSKVGSEHLPDGVLAPAGEMSPSPGEEEAAASYPVPAPVLEAEPSAPIDLGHPADQPEAAQQAVAGAVAAAESDEDADDRGGAEDDAEAAPDGEDKPKGRGKKRKGRKRG